MHRYRWQRFLLRLNVLRARNPKVIQSLKTFLLILFAFFLLNILNLLIFSTVLLFEENEHEPDYNFDTQPFYKLIEEKKRFDQSGNYLVIKDFLRYQQNLTKNAERLGLILHSNINDLQLLAKHSVVWDGPISLSIFVKGSRASDDLDFALIWFRCHRKLFKMIDVHLIISGKAYESN